MIKNVKIILLNILVFCTFGCSKTELLDAKPSQSLVIPNTLEDFQAILDHDHIMNGSVNGQGLVPQIGDIGSDDYYILENEFSNRLTDRYRSFHIWDESANSTEDLLDWSRPYQCVLYANIVLDGLQDMEPGTYDIERWQQIKGAALFYRAHAFYQLAQVFAYPFGQKGKEMYGIPLRLSSDISEDIVRNTVPENYNQIVGDLEEASTLLPLKPVIKERPSQAASYALLARVYLSMREYDKALASANLCLNVVDTLLDYNELNPASNYPFLNSRIMETEVLFKSSFVSPSGITNPLSTFVAKIDNALFESYEPEDLRKTIFFRSATPLGFRYKGSYYGSNNMFGGLATDEVYLIKAECEARTDQLDLAVMTLEHLRKKRYQSESTLYKVPVHVTQDKDALTEFIKAERRRQLPFRGLRWTDIRRYNLDKPEITLERNINGNNYILLPNDDRYAFLIPENVIGFNLSMEQNPR